MGLVFSACTGREPSGSAPAADPELRTELLVYTVNYPLRYFAERIGGDRVRVEFPAPADVDPAFWSPGPETVAAYQAADLILLNGAGYARWVPRVTLPPSRLVDTSRSFRDRLVQVEDAVLHTHGPGGKHSHGETVFTTWLDPTLAVEQARAILEAIVATSPEHEERLRDRFASLERDLLDLDRELRDLVSEGSPPLIASHPVYQYFSRRYGLDLVSVHFEPDEFPPDREWRKLEIVLVKHPAKWMLWEGEPLPETVRKLSELGLESVVYDPCGNAPQTGNYLENMKENLNRFRMIFEVGMDR